MLLVLLSALCPPAPLKSLTFWCYTNQIIIIIIMNIDEMQMSTLSEELSLMLSCLRESQLQAAQCRAGVTAADSATTDSRRHVDIVRRRYDVCFTRAEWRMTEQDGQIGLADLLLANFLYTKLNHDDDSGYHQLELGAFKVTRSFPPLFLPTVITDRHPLHGLFSRRSWVSDLLSQKAPCGLRDRK